MHGDADVMGKLRINQHEMLEISITKVQSQLSFGKELSSGKAVGCQIGERHPIRCTEKNVDSPSSRAIAPLEPLRQRLLCQLSSDCF